MFGARMVIGRAFDWLKARFGALRRPMGINLDDLPYVVFACFNLQNLCELNGQSLVEETGSEAALHGSLTRPSTDLAPGRRTDETKGRRVRILRFSQSSLNRKVSGLLLLSSMFHFLLAIVLNSLRVGFGEVSTSLTMYM